MHRMFKCNVYRPEIHLNVIEIAHRWRNFLKTLVLQETFSSVGLRKNLF